MRTTIIPAQITTVEDRIAGSLNITQIMLLILAVFGATAIFTILPPANQLTIYKIPVICINILVFLVLALRIKGKVVINWLITLFKYNLRPGYYVFDKNDTYLREILTDNLNEATDEEPVDTKVKVPHPNKEAILADLIRFEGLVESSKKSLSFRVNKKGGLDVALK
jgi:hypothetical protein